MNQIAIAEANVAKGKQIAMDVISEFQGIITPWEPCHPDVVGKWEYATLTIRETSMRIGVSSGAVISLDGHPFDPEGQLNITHEAVRRSINEKVSRTLARRVAVILVSGPSFTRPNGSARFLFEMVQSLEELSAVGIDPKWVEQYRWGGLQIFACPLEYAKFVEETHLMLLEADTSDDLWGSDCETAMGNLVFTLLGENGIDLEGHAYCLKATSQEICTYNIEQMTKRLLANYI